MRIVAKKERYIWEKISQSYKYFCHYSTISRAGFNFNLSASSETARVTHERNPLVFHTRRLRLLSCTGRPGNSWSYDLRNQNIPRSRMHTYVNSSCRPWSLDQCQCVRIYTCIFYLFVQQVVEAETREEGATGTESEPRIAWHWYGTIMLRGM